MLFRIFDYIFLMRPILWVPGWTFLLLGFYKGRLNVGAQNFEPLLLVGAFILSTFTMGGIYVLNQIIDIESDRINKKLYLLPEGYIKVPHAWIAFFSLFVVAWALALSIPFPLAFRIILFISMLFGILYSVPPFKFKDRPVLDLLSNSIGYGMIAFLLGWSIETPLSKYTLLYSLPYFFAVGAVFINTTIPDINGDKLTKKITTGVWLGPSKSYWLSTAFIFVSFALSVWVGDWICGIAAIIATPLFLLTAIKRDLKWCFISIRVSAPIFALLVCILFPFFILLLLLVLFGLRLYYKRRFNIIYPKIV